MANYMENTEKKEQAWDMEFKDPFSLEEDESPAVKALSGIVNQPAARRRTSKLSEGSLLVEPLNEGSVQKVTVTGDRKRSGMELPKRKNSQHQSETEANHSSRMASVAESSRTPRVNERSSRTSCDGTLSHDTDAKLNDRKVSLASSEEQSPIPVVLSSAKRFCTSDDIEGNQAAKQDSAYFRLPPPSAVSHNSAARFAQPAYPPVVYNIPPWLTVSVPLPVNNSGTAMQVHPVVPYNSCVPYSASLPHSNIPALYNQSPTSLVEGTGAANWSRAGLHLQSGILSKPPPPIPAVSRTALLGVPGNDFAAPVTQLHNGLTTVPQVIAPLPPSSISRLPFSTVVLPQPGQPLKGAPLQLDNNASVSSRVPTIRAQQSLPLSANAGVSACLLSSALLKSNNNNNGAKYNSKHTVLNDKTAQQSRPMPATSCTGLVISNVCQSLTSPVLPSKQTLMSTTATSSSNVPALPPTKLNSRFAQLDPRIYNGSRLNSAAAQSRPAVSASLTPSTAFVVPVPPPLPSLEELTAETREHLQKDDKAIVVSSVSQSTSSSTITTDSTKLDMFQTDRTEVVEEQVRTALKPFFKGGLIDKEAYKEIMRKAVPKICASRSTDISTTRVQSFIDAYVAKVTNADRRKSCDSSSSTGSNTSRQDSL